MRLKTFTAANVQEAMALVKQHMGVDAVILSTKEDVLTNRISVTAALEDEGGEMNGHNQAFALADHLLSILNDQGIPASVSEKIIAAAAKTNADAPLMALSGALDESFSFNPIDTIKQNQPVMLMGIPGVGKTVTIAKLAARAVIKKQSIFLVTTDTEKTGAIDQLNGYSEVLKVPLKVAHTPALLEDELKTAPKGAQIFIDTAGINPFIPEEVARLKAFAIAAKAEPVLVMTSGGDALDACDIAHIFTDELKCKKLIVTRVDIARRLGSIVAAADTAQLHFSHVSVTPHIIDGLSNLNPVVLARLLMGERAEKEQSHGKN